MVMLTGCGFQVAASREDAAIEGANDAPGESLSIDAPPDMMTSVNDLVIEAESATALTMPRVHGWAKAIDKPGFSGTAFMELQPNNGAACPGPGTDTIAQCSAAMIYNVIVPIGGSYTFHVRMWADSAANDSVYVTVDDPSSVTALEVDVVQDSTWHWTKSAAVYNIAAGPHQLAILHREGGARVDKLAFTISAAPPP
ncbi:hypothetical protein BH11MYX3_BH11MYX3_25880 [soil metagenome]